MSALTLAVEISIKSIHQIIWATKMRWPILFGGDEEDRTLDLRIANATLSQLSYIPELNVPILLILQNLNNTANPE